jgi:small ligand-binding sensory domain FIST
MSNKAASRLVLEPFSEAAVTRAARECLEELGCNPSVVLVFASPDYRPHLADFLELVQLHSHASLLLGGSAWGLLGPGVEMEEATGFCILLLHLPHTRLSPVTFNEQQADDFTPEQWRNLVGDAADSEAWLFLGNPAKMGAELWLKHWSTAFPGVPAIGGLLSGGDQDEDLFVFHNRQVVEAGIALGFKGGFKLHLVIAQGCRPIGEPHAITGAEDNVLTSIGSVPAYQRLNESIESLSKEERRGVGRNLFAGFAADEYMDDFRTGDFVIRNLLGTDPESGTVELAAFPRVGQTFQFQLRDPAAADEELEHQLLSKLREGVRPVACAAFVCRGRGQSLFGKPNHDMKAVQQHFGVLPTIGLFCNGEVGPGGRSNVVHGYTAVIGLLA